MTKKPKFQKRYVLGEGYPNIDSQGIRVSLLQTKDWSSAIMDLKYPDKLVEVNIPKYRLVLERVKP